MKSQKNDINLEDADSFVSKEGVRELFQGIKMPSPDFTYVGIRAEILNSEGMENLVSHSLLSEDKGKTINMFRTSVSGITNLHELALLISPKYRNYFCTNDAEFNAAKFFEQAICERRFYFKSSAEWYLKQLEDTLLVYLKEKNIIDLDKVINKLASIEDMKKTLRKE